MLHPLSYKGFGIILVKGGRIIQPKANCKKREIIYPAVGRIPL
jgi:hypothetical protein